MDKQSVLVLIIVGFLASRFPSAVGFEVTDDDFSGNNCSTTTENYINLKDNLGNAPLHLAASRGSPILVETLLKMGADVNAIDAQGNTPLHLILNSGSAHNKVNNIKIIVQLLMEHKASLEVQNNSGETPLIRAIKNNYNTDVAEVLMNNGANVNSKDFSGSMPLHYAVEQGNEDLTRLCIKFGANVSVPDKDGNTPLHLSVFKGNINTARILIEHGATVNEKNQNEDTPLLCAFHTSTVNPLDIYWYTKPVTGKLDPEMIKFLLENGADPNEKQQGNYVIHLAVMFSMESTVKLLLKNGADVKVQNREGKLPIHIAIASNLQIAQLLLAEESCTKFSN